MASWQFQSTPPRRGRPRCRVVSALRWEFQSTPPRRGRPQVPGVSGRERGVSIHAPAKGATWSACASRPRASCFNPRPREGGDHIHGHFEAVFLGVSIHAPAKGATGQLARKIERYGVSIHAPAKGATPRAAWSWPPAPFQSTPPRRGRRCPRMGLARGGCFNPRPREGGDPLVLHYERDGFAFQSTPPRRGRRRLSSWPTGADFVSIHAPAKGAT